jgi:hypothetical protein
MLEGLGANASSSYKDIVKNCKAMMTDKTRAVRVASAHCLHALAAQSTILHAELDSCVSACIKAFEDSDYPTRRAVAEFLGYLLATAHLAPSSPCLVSYPHHLTFERCAASKPPTLVELFGLLSSPLVKGGQAEREVRLGAHCAPSVVQCRPGARRGHRGLLVHVCHARGHVD